MTVILTPLVSLVLEIGDFVPNVAAAMWPTAGTVNLPLMPLLGFLTILLLPANDTTTLERQE